jgi:hypothetical protein
MPYLDINPHRQRLPKWIRYVGLGILAALTVVVVVAALTGT